MNQIWYREELKALHEMVVLEIKARGSTYDAVQLSALFHLGQKLLAEMDTAPSGFTAAGVS